MTEKKRTLRFGLPKGSLQEATIEKMAKAGFNIHLTKPVDPAELTVIVASVIGRTG